MVEIKESEFSRLAEYILNNYGIYLKSEKQSLINARLAGVVEQQNFNSFSEYYDYLVTDSTGAAAETLIDKISTNYTYFMREPEHFRFLNNRVLPGLERTIPDKDLRIWSAGCSTGEEPYTIAILLEEYFKSKFGWDKQILATDVASSAMEAAKKGIYEESQIDVLPPLWRLNYFNKLPDGKMQVKEQLRREVAFRSLNLISHFGYQFKRRFHVIFCRNVMIYFNSATRQELVGRFYDLTEPGGYLFIGHTESLDREQTRYKYIAPAIYRKE